MKFGVTILGITSLAALTGTASAAPPPPPRVGFQMAIRTGYSVPMGQAQQGADMSDFVSGQVPFIVDIGGKIIPQLFLGGYFGLGFGAPAGTVKRECDLLAATCVAVGLHLGIEVQYHFLPHGSVNPWLGYGLGIESTAVSLSVDNRSQSLGYTGFEFARLMGGVDFRINRVFGLGPFVDLSLSQFNRISDESTSATIPNQATHQWLTIGARFVFFP